MKDWNHLDNSSFLCGSFEVLRSVFSNRDSRLLKCQLRWKLKIIPKAQPGPHTWLLMHSFISSVRTAGSPPAVWPLSTLWPFPLQQGLCSKGYTNCLLGEETETCRTYATHPSSRGSTQKALSPILEAAIWQEKLLTNTNSHHVMRNLPYVSGLPRSSKTIAMFRLRVTYGTTCLLKNIE